MERDKPKMIAAHVPPALAAELRELAERRDRSVSAELRLAIAEWIALNSTDAERVAA